MTNPFLGNDNIQSKLATELTLKQVEESLTGSLTVGGTVSINNFPDPQNTIITDVNTGGAQTIPLDVALTSNTLTQVNIPSQTTKLEVINDGLPVALGVTDSANSTCVNIASDNTVATSSLQLPISLGPTTAVNCLPVTLSTDEPSIMTDTNLTEVKGVAISTNTGVADASTIRVVHASDSSIPITTSDALESHQFYELLNSNFNPLDENLWETVGTGTAAQVDNVYNITATSGNTLLLRTIDPIDMPQQAIIDYEISCAPFWSTTANNDSWFGLSDEPTTGAIANAILIGGDETNSGNFFIRVISASSTTTITAFNGAGFSLEADENEFLTFKIRYTNTSNPKIEFYQQDASNEYVLIHTHNIILDSNFTSQIFYPVAYVFKNNAFVTLNDIYSVSVKSNINHHDRGPGISTQNTQRVVLAEDTPISIKDVTINFDKSNYNQIFASNLVYGEDLGNGFEDTVSATTTRTHDSDSQTIAISSSTSGASYVRKSRQIFHPPRFSQTLLLFQCNVQGTDPANGATEIGLFNDDSGSKDALLIRHDAGAMSIRYWSKNVMHDIAQADWDDRLDNKGQSEVAIDFTKTQLFAFLISSNRGNIACGILNEESSEIIPFHTIRQVSDSENRPFGQNSFKIAYEYIHGANSNNYSNTVGECALYNNIEHGHRLGYTRSHISNFVTTISSSAPNPVIGIRYDASADVSNPERVRVRILSFGFAGLDSPFFTVGLYVNPTIGSVSWTRPYEGTSRYDDSSVVQIATGTNGTTLTANTGILIASTVVGTPDSFGEADHVGHLDVAQSIYELAEGDEVYVAVRGSSSGGDGFAVLTWVEG